MGMVISQYEVYLVDLDPTKGHEIQKTRPCLVISPDEMNHTISTVIIAPMTTKSHPFPTRIELEFNKKTGWIVLDQIRTIDKTRLIKRMGNIDDQTIQKVKTILKEMLVD
uniref:mRNA interferase n=1 Tax=Gracilinema caldarium TaxID=215591 RepID=A0A7C3EGM2_9SPIR